MHFSSELFAGFMKKLIKDSLEPLREKIPESFLKTHGEILEGTPGVVIEGTFVKKSDENPRRILEKTTADFSKSFWGNI